MLLEKTAEEQGEHHCVWEEAMNLRAGSHAGMLIGTTTLLLVVVGCAHTVELSRENARPIQSVAHFPSDELVPARVALLW